MSRLKKARVLSRGRKKRVILNNCICMDPIKKECIKGDRTSKGFFNEADGGIVYNIIEENSCGMEMNPNVNLSSS